MTVLVIGSGAFSETLAARLGSSGARVERTLPARPGRERATPLPPELVQAVVLPDPGTGPGEHLIEHIDGPRWLVFSWNAAGAPSAGDSVANRTPEEEAVARGATVVHLPTVFGHGADTNVTRLVRLARRGCGVAAVVDGDRLVQPLHFDDLEAFLGCHRRSPVAGTYEIAGPEALPVVEVWESVVEVLGTGRVPLPPPAASLLGRVGTRLLGEIRWGAERPPVDVRRVGEAFEWLPAPVGVRLEQAVHEASR